MKASTARFVRVVYGILGLAIVGLIPACSLFQSDSPVQPVSTPLPSGEVPPTSTSTSTPTPAPVVATSPPAPPAPITPPAAQQKRSLAAPPPDAPPLPGAEKANIKVGDKLWYRGGSGKARPSTIVREAISIQGGQVQYKQSDVDAGGMVSNRSRSRRQSLKHLELDTSAKSTGLMKYADFPLTVGKSWTYRYQLKGKNGLPVTYDVVATVDGEERVSTPAGSFETLRISHVGKWAVPVVQGGALKTSSGTLKSTVWFAMSLGNWARFESEVLNAKGGADVKVWQELIQFERKGS
jgi:hypothetical protein